MATEERQVRIAGASVTQRLAGGDDTALAELYDRLAGTAYGLAYAILRDTADAEEAVADAFAQVWRSAGQFDAARGSVDAWVFTITRTRALDRLRSRRRQMRLLDEAAQQGTGSVVLPDPPPAADRELSRREVGARVRESLQALPEPQRRVIELAYFGGLSQTEIAARLSEPLGTVKTRMRSAMEKLRAALAPLREEVSP